MKAEVTLDSQNPLVVVRELTLGDLREVARVHCHAFPQAALTLLGPEATYRYYHWQRTGPHQCVALGAWADGQLCGYSFGGRFQGAMQGFLRKNAVHLLLSVAVRPNLLMYGAFRERVGVAFRSLARGFSRPRSAGAQGKSEPAPISRGHFGILAIGVDPAMRRLGIGRLLMDRSEAAARKWGAVQMGLSVASSNTKAIAFYEALGWQREQPTAGGNMRMIKELSQEPKSQV